MNLVCFVTKSKHCRNLYIKNKTLGKKKKGGKTLQKINIRLMRYTHYMCVLCVTMFSIYVPRIKKPEKN